MTLQSPLIRKVAFTALLFTVAPHLAKAADAVVHTVTIELMKFDPASLVVKKGDTIKWINKDIVPHTVTESKKRFDSGIMNADGSWKYTAAVSGKFEYICTFHPTMKAMITVQ